MTPRKNVHPVSTSFVPTQAIIDQATIDALEGIIAECKKKRDTLTKVSIEITRRVGFDPELEHRDEGFRGALAWVENLCCQEINRVRGVVKDDEGEVPTTSA